MGDSITNGAGCGSGTVVNNPVNVVISSGGGGTTIGNVWVQNTLTVTTAFTSQGTASFVNLNAQYLIGDGSNISSLNASNITSGTLDPSHLQPSGVTAQVYGGVSNVPQLTIDQWGRVTAATNAQTQWTPTSLFNIATSNGVSIGTLNDPPIGSNLYVRGTANVDTMNVNNLFANTVTIFGLNTLNVYGTSNMNAVYASNYYGNASRLSNISGSSISGNVANSTVALVVSGGAQPNITSVGTLTGLNIQGLLIVSNGYGISNINGANVSGNVANSTVALVVSGGAQPNITSVGTLTGLKIQGLLVASDGSGISGINGSNLVGNVASANLALIVTGSNQPNITNVGTLSNLTVSGLLIASNASGLSNINGSNVTGNVANSTVALVVSGGAQPNITSVGTLTGLKIQGLLIASDGSGISGINGSNLVGNVANSNVALVVSGGAQPNITSVGTLTGLNIQGLLIVSNGSGISNINGANVSGNVANSTVALVVSGGAQPNIMSVGILSNLTVSGFIISSNGYGISNLNASNLTGNVANSNVALVVSQAAQPNITSVGTLTSLNIQGLLIVSNGSGIANISASNISGTVATAGVVTNPAQVNITSVGTLTSLEVTGVIKAGLFTGNGSALSNLQASNIIGSFPLADSVSLPAQPNITSVGLLSNLAVSNSVTTGNVWANSLSVTALSGKNPVQFVSDSGSFLMTNTGRIGINLTNPTSQLEIFQSGASTVAINLSDTVVGPGGGVRLTKDSSQNMILENDSGGTADSLINNYSTTRFRMYATLGQALVEPIYIGPTTIPSPSQTTALYIVGNAYVSNSVTTTNIYATQGYFSGVTISPGIMSAPGFSGTNFTGTNFNIVSGGNISIAGSLATSGYYLQTTGTQVQWAPAATVSTTFTGSAFNGGTFQGSTFSGTTITASTGFTGAAFTGGSFQGSTMSGTTITASTGFTGAAFTGGTFQGSTITASTGFTGAAYTGGTFYGTTANLTSSANIVSANILTLNVYGTANGYFGGNFSGTAFSGGSFQGSTFSGTTITASTGFTGAAYTGGTFYGTTANLTSSANIYSANILTLNVYGTANGYFGGNFSGAAFSGGSFQGSTMSGTTITASTGFTGAAFSGGSFQGSTMSGTTITASTGFTGAAFTGGTFQGTTVTASTGFTGAAYTGGTFYGTTANLTTGANIVTLNTASANLTTGNVGTLNVSQLSVTSLANVTFLNVSSTANVTNLSVSSNIVPAGISGNTYLTGNIIVSGNVFTSIGTPLGAGGGYYFSLPSDIATQTPYTGAIYGTTYPLSVGLSNGFTINGTSTLISVTPNGNFKFVVGGAYKISAVFNGSDNITGLALGLSSTDVHGTDQGYLYRYTTQITQNPTELIEIPFNVSDVSKYYYLDLFLTASGTLKATTTSSGGTYLTITPLQGGGLATGGPGGTPGTQWISSDSNIYFPNAIGVGGAPTPGYNLTVTGQSQMGNVLPTVDNLYNLGTPAFRWANLQIGPGTIYMQDQAPPYTQVGISVYNGTLLLDNIQSVRTGNVVYIDPVTTYLATSNVTNKVLTYSNVSAVKANAVIYSDGLTQSNAYIKPTSNVLPTSPTVTSVLVDLASSNAFVHCHAGSSLNISVVNPTPAKEVHVFVTVNAGGPKPWGLITCTGIGNILTANTVDSNPYYVYQTICKVSVTSVDTTTQNTFAVIENYYHT